MKRLARNMMKRIISKVKGYLPLTLLLLLMAMLATPVFAAYDYYAPISIFDNTATPVSNVPVLVVINNSNLNVEGYIQADALDTDVQESASVPYSVGTSRMGIFVSSLAAYQTKVYNYLMTYTPLQTSYPLIIGYGGHIDTTDHADLELGGAFEIEQDGFVDTDAGSDKNLIYKQGAFRTYISAEDNITADILAETTTTFYPDPNVEVTSVDGYAEDTGNDLTWATLIVEPGTAASDAGTWQNCIGFKASGTADQWAELSRGIYLFDTSALPDNAEILSATFSIYGHSKIDTNVVTPDINVYASTPFADTALQADDFVDVGSTPFCDTPITYAGWSVVGYNDFTLNSDGIAAISLTGITKLGTRNANYDVAATPPIAWVINAFSYLRGYYADEALQTKDPKLVVTYEVVSKTVTATGISSGEHKVKVDTTDSSLDFVRASTDWVQVADHDDFSFIDGLGADEPFTIIAEINLDDASSNAIVGKRDASANKEYIFGTDATDKLYLRVYEKVPNAYAGRESDAITAQEGSWTHVACTYDGSEAPAGIDLFLNGVPNDTADSSALPYTGMTNTSSDVEIGSIHVGTAENLDGFMRELKIYNRELSDTEVLADYNGTHSGVGLIGWWKMNEGTGNPQDSSGLGHHGVNQGADWILGDLQISIDDILEDSTALANAVPDEASDWIINENTVAPYINYLKFTTPTGFVLWYQPVTMIVNQAIDRTGNGHHGAITWGTNPSGIEYSIGGIVGATDFVPPGGEDGEIAPLPIPSDWNVTATNTTGVTTFFLYDLVNRTAISLGFSASTMYVIIGLIAATGVGFGALIGAGNMLAFSIGFGVTAGLFASTGVMPWWVIIIIILVIAMGIYSWRRG